MFLEPVFLWGTAAASVPILIHMMQSPRARTIDFPTIRFLLACQKRATRRTRIKNLILLLMRIALFLLIAFALAKPWQENEKTAVRPDALVSMVIVLDNSYSMGYAERGVTRFEQARQAALGLIDTLKPGDEVAVLLMNDEMIPAVPGFTADMDRAKQGVRQAALTVRGTNVDPALREAIRLAGAAKAKAAAAASDPKKDAEKAEKDDEKDRPHRREIHLLTDLQASSWEPVFKSNFLKNTDTDATLYVTSFGRKGSANAFIESAAVTAASPEQVTITASVRAVGAGSPGNVATLTVDGKGVAQEPFAVRVGAPAQVPLTARLTPGAPHKCILSLQDDSLPLDDKYYFTVEVGERSKVLVVDGDPSAIPHMSETFFLAHALNPGPAVTGEGPPPIDARVVTAAEFPGAKLADFRIVVLCNLPSLDGAELVKLENFLRDGGSVFIFLGDKVNAEQYNAWTFLPISLTNPVGDPTKKQSFGFGEQRGDHPMFKNPIDVRSTRFFVCYGSAPGSLKKDAIVIARFANANSQPALVEWRFGKGRVLLFTSSCDLAWNNFPLRRAFLPWLHQALYYLASQDSKGNAYRLREEVTFQALASHYKDRITVTNPAGQRTVLNPQLKGAYAETSYKGTDQPGLYSVAADPAFSNATGFGVNLDVTESVIDTEDPDKIVKAAPAGLVKFIDGPKRSVVEEVKRTREGKEHWKLLLQLALLMFLVESLFSNLISRGKKAGGVKAPLFEVLRQRTPGIT